MGQVYFNDLQDYDNAQAYYDSAATVITEQDPEFKEIKNLAETLKDYITYKNTMAYQDSMLYLASLPKEKVDKLIDEIIEEEKAKKEAENQRLLEELNNNQSNNPFFNQNLNQQNRRQRSGSSGGVWYFDNPNAISNGRIQFQQQWSNRKNEDNWRRSKRVKVGQLANEEEDDKAEVDSALLALYGNKAQYYQDIPKNDEEKALAHQKIAEAMYKLGQLYSQKLNEPDSAIVLFDKLVRRYPDSDFMLPARYSLYKLFLAKGNNKAQVYKNYILNNHPNTVFALLIQGRDPNELRKEEEEFKYAYNGLFSAYSNKQYETSIGFSEFLLAQVNASESPIDLDMAQIHYIRECLMAIPAKKTHCGTF